MNTGIQLASNLPFAGNVSSPPETANGTDGMTGQSFASFMLQMGSIGLLAVEEEESIEIEKETTEQCMMELFAYLSDDVKKIVEELVGLGESSEDEELEALHIASLLFIPLLFQTTDGKKVMTAMQQGSGKTDEKLLQQLAVTCEESLTEEKIEVLKNLLQEAPNTQKQTRVEYVGQLVQRVIERVSEDGKTTKEVEVIRPQPFTLAGPVNDIVPQQVIDSKAFALYVGANTKAMDAGQFIRDFQNILSASNFTNGQGMQKLTIKLYPEHLGSLRIELVKRGEEMVAKIIASSTTTKDMLESQVQQLRTALSSQHISVDKVEISSYLQQWKEDHSREQQEAPEKKQKQEVDEEKEQEKSFFEELMNWKV